jgi:predicted acylesterase/phospholipase RssA
MKKVTLVISGGGVRGSFQAGFLYALLESNKYEIEEIHATSIGAILAPLAINGKKDALKNIYEDIKAFNDIFTKWWFPISIFKFFNIFLKLGMFKSLDLPEQMWNTLEKDEQIKAANKCRISSFNYSKNKEDWFGGDGDTDKFLNGLKASTALWLLVPPFKIENQFYIDGGSCNLFPVNLLLNSNTSDRKIIFIDNSTRNPKIERTEPKNALDLMFNLHDESLNNLGSLQLELLKIKYKDNLVIIRPEEDIFKNNIDFDKNKMKRFFHEGYIMFEKNESRFFDIIRSERVIKRKYD